MNHFLKQISVNLLRSIVLIAVLFPVAASAQQTTLIDYFVGFTRFFDGTIIPLFFAMAVLVLLYYILQYFIIESSDAYARETARKYIIYAIAGLVIITSLWGIIEIISAGLGIDDGIPVCPDYVDDCRGYGTGNSGSGGSDGNFGSSNSTGNNNGGFTDFFQVR